jgi:hypothetical protein
MTIHWDALLAVFAVSLAATVTVVGLVTVALLGVSARAPRLVRSDPVARPLSLSRRAGTAVTATCLTLAAAVVLVGLWAIVAR